VLRTELDNRQWEVESLQGRLDSTTAERDAAHSELKALKASPGARSASGGGP